MKKNKDTQLLLWFIAYRNIEVDSMLVVGKKIDTSQPLPARRERFRFNIPLPVLNFVA